MRDYAQCFQGAKRTYGSSFQPAFSLMILAKKSRAPIKAMQLFLRMLRLLARESSMRQCN